MSDLERVAGEVSAFALELKANSAIETDDGEKDEMRDEVRGLIAELAGLPRSDCEGAIELIEQIKADVNELRKNLDVPAARKPGLAKSESCGWLRLP